MPYKDYWYGDPWMIVDFRKADRINQERINHELWLQGMYVYHGISIAISNAFGKKGSRPMPYPDKPYEIYPKSKEQVQAEIKKQSEKEKEKAVAFFERIAPRKKK